MVCVNRHSSALASAPIPSVSAVRRRGTVAAPEQPADEETPMTDTNEAVITEAVSVIDAALSRMMSRELVTSGEVTDVLLDVRSLLTVPVQVPVPANS